jgi:SNF family Na+-dependent transporter
MKLNKYFFWFRDVIFLTLINEITCFLAGFVIFSVLGFMAKQANMPVGDVVEQGPGLVFIVYPTALDQLPWSQMWSAMFFLMLLFVGLDSQVN